LKSWTSVRGLNKPRFSKTLSKNMCWAYRGNPAVSDVVLDDVGQIEAVLRH
jgi:hypothetical protein